jgi:hypothetical protein
MIARILPCLLLVAVAPEAASRADAPPERLPREIQSARAADYYPLRVGSELVYSTAGMKLSMKVSGTEALPDKVTGYKIEVWTNGAVAGSEVVGIDGAGVKRFKFNGVAATAPVLFLAADPVRRREWKVDAAVQGQAIQGTLRATREKVTVPAGTYDAVRVSAEKFVVAGQKMDMDAWYVRGVGMVKQRIALAGLDVVMELEKYTPGK